MLQTKRFIGNDLARLYRRVRTELGEDALIFSTRTLHREGGAPLIEIQASPPADDDALPFELQQAMLSTVLSRVAPGMKVPDLEDLVLRGVLGPSAVADVTAATVPGDGIEDAAGVYAPPAHPAEVPGQRMDERTTANDFMEAGISAAAAGAIEATYPGLAAEPALVAYLKRLPVTYPDEYETALVSIDGPAGGGRSTALLRMALDCSEAGRAAVLVATNAYRREEVDRLAAYAEVLGLDFVVAADDRGVEKAVRKVARGSVLFVDAEPGWVPPAFVRAPFYRYVALPASWPVAELKAQIEDAGHGSFAGAIPTFTDIATNLIPVVSTVVALGTGIAFLSSGSDISNGITVADAESIASGIFSMRTGGRTDGRLVASA